MENCNLKNVKFGEYSEITYSKDSYVNMFVTTNYIILVETTNIYVHNVQNGQS